MPTAKQLTDIERLQQQVEAHDQLELKLNWDMLRSRNESQLDFLYYERDELIAFVALYPFGSTVEATGMVKPGNRRQGHFTKLFATALDSAKQAGYKKMLLNAPATAQGAKEFLKKHGAVYEFTEHQMRWEPKLLGETTGFTLRPATEDDLDMRVRLDVEAFHLPADDAREMESRVNTRDNTEILMIEWDQQTVGKIRIHREDGQAWIYGFAILPEHQGKGIGRRVLQHVVKQQSGAGYSVHLDVETKNAHALGLYESVGFQVVHAQDYYDYPTAK